MTLAMEIKTSSPKVAIIIPVYNTEKYLPDCLESIQEQTYKNYVIYAVNDGSTDSSRKILQTYEEKEPRLIVINQKNAGQGNARNTAINEVIKSKTFDYVSFIDSDDIVLPNFLETLVSSAEKYNSDITSCNYFRFNDNSTPKKSKRHLPLQEGNVDDFIAHIFMASKWKDKACSAGMVCMKLFKAETLTHTRFPTSRDTVEDEAFCVNACLNAKKFLFIPNFLYGYRIRDNSSVYDKNFKKHALNGRLLCLKLGEKLGEEAITIIASSIIKSYSQLLDEKEIPSTHAEYRKVRHFAIKAAKQNLISTKSCITFILVSKNKFIRAFLDKYFGTKQKFKLLKTKIKAYNSHGSMI